MTPPQLDPLSVQAKLRQLAVLLEDLDELGEVSEERLTGERLTLRAVERLITQVVEVASSTAGHIAASHLPVVSSTYRGSFADAASVGALSTELAASLGAAAGMRNLLVHHYAGVDLGLVASAVPLLRADAAAFVSQVSRWLAART